jgi:predicted Zn finger-like uncharacterized protein
MIISCPSCSARYDMPASHFAQDGAMIKCSACGYSWLEARAVEIANVSVRQLAVAGAQPVETDHEVRRLVEASRDAQDQFAARRRQRRKRMAAWSALVAAACLPLIVAGLAPEVTVRYVPAAIVGYSAVGWDANVYGLDFRRVEAQHLIVNGARVLAVKGDIANISGHGRKIPSIRFALRDGASQEVYNWTLDSGARPLKPGEVTGFVTRVASPPETAKDLEIRFAHADEIGSNSGHE